MKEGREVVIAFAPDTMTVIQGPICWAKEHIKDLEYVSSNHVIKNLAQLEEWFSIRVRTLVVSSPASYILACASYILTSAS